MSDAPGAPVLTGGIDGNNAAVAAPPKEGMPATAPRPVEAAFALGWHVAELVNLHSEPASGPPLGMLSQVSNLDFADRVDLLCRQITLELSQLPHGARDNLPMFAKDEILASVAGIDRSGSSLAPASGSATSGTEQLAFLNPRHVAILTTLTAVSFELGKAYSLGVGLGETVSRAFEAARAGDSVAEVSWPDLFREPQVALLTGQLRDLKSNFAPYAVDPVASTLTDWGTWVRSTSTRRSEAAAGDAGYWLTIARDDFYPQALIWRALLSGEKLPTDALKVGDYVAALRHLVSTYGEVAKGVLTKGLVITAGVLAGALMVVVVILAALNMLSGALTTLVGLLGVLGLSGASVTVAVRKALNQAEASLWDAEIAAAVATAIDRVPEQLPNSSVHGLRAGPAVRQRPALQGAKPEPRSPGGSTGQPTLPTPGPEPPLGN